MTYGTSRRRSRFAEIDGRCTDPSETDNACRLLDEKQHGHTMCARAMSRLWVLCHEHRRSTRRCATVLEMKEGPSGSAIRSLIPSHRKWLCSKGTVVSVAETSGR